MFKNVFLAPGRILAKAFKDKKRNYRSVRSKTPGGPGVVLVSLGFWFLIVAGLLVAVDKSGLLKEVLDAGVEVAQTAGGAGTPEGDAAEGAGAAPPAAGGEATDGERNAAQPSGTTGALSGNLSNPGTGPATSTASGTTEAAAERWLVILHTIPKMARDEAERRQNQYRAQGLAVEIMDTDAFPRLLGGNWVIAQGPFDSRDQALDAAAKARAFNADLMVRRGL